MYVTANVHVCERYVSCTVPFSGVNQNKHYCYALEKKF